MAKNVQLKQPTKTASQFPQRWMRHLLEKSPALVYLTDDQGVFLDINSPGAAMLGGESREDFIGKASIDSFFASAKDCKRLRKCLAEQGFVQDYETRFRRMDKTAFDVRITRSCNI